MKMNIGREVLCKQGGTNLIWNDMGQKFKVYH